MSIRPLEAALPKVSLGVDIGGTFTDFVAIDQRTGRTQVAKVLTTPGAPADAVLQGIQHLLGADGLNTVERIVHGTTLAANLVLEGKGARVALLSTQGFRDVLEMRRGNRVLYDLFYELPPPLVPRNLRQEVAERILSSGEVFTALSPSSVETAWRTLQPQGIEALAICFMHSYRNPKHEYQARDILNSLNVDVPISLSCETSPEMREFERASTTVINAYVQPAMRQYLAKLSDALTSRSFKGSFFIMLSDGGMAPKETAERFPVRVIESGPAAGMLAAGATAAAAGLPRCIGFDMGGTTAKVCLIEAGKVATRPTFEVARRYHLEKGTGYPLNIPSVDLTEVGQGGGSIAHLDRMGLLQVGPGSAGADPGPACYGRGGRQPTVTDADLVLGYLDPAYFLGGAMQLSMAPAEQALHETIAQPMGSTVAEAALAVYDLVNENMAQAIRLHCLGRGDEPARFSLIAFGGAAPVHACQVAEKLGIRTIIVPSLAGVNSAAGLLTAPVSMTLSRQVGLPLTAPALNQLWGHATALEHQAAELLFNHGPRPPYTTNLVGQMRYQGQTHTVSVDLGSPGPEPHSETTLKMLFEQEYERHFLRTNSRLPAEVVTLQVRVASADAQMQWQPPSMGAPASAAAGNRLIQWPGVGPLRCPFFRGAAPGKERISGPVIIEDVNTTIVVGPAWVLRVDELGNVKLERH
jgi:N-methylhydantoinase A